VNQQNPIIVFKQQLNGLQDKGELALPDTVPFKNFQNAAIVAVSDNPSILSCDRQSVFKALRTLAAAGLVPDGREAAIVPFKGSARAMPMVAGLVKVARNSGKISTLWSEIVYEGETLNVWIEDGERKWDHVQDDGTPINVMKRGGKIIGAYAVAKLTDGTVEFQPMSFDDIEKRRIASANQKDAENPSGIWRDWYEEMAKKTVIRNLCKRLPMSSDDMERLMVEQDRIAGLRDVTPKDEPTALQRKVMAARGEDMPPEPQSAPVEGETIEGQAETPDEQNDAPAPAHWTEKVDASDASPGADEWDEGVKAAQAGMKRTMCRHEPGSQQAKDWLGGYDAAIKAKEAAE
jgi:recombination protein RecT